MSTSKEYGCAVRLIEGLTGILVGWGIGKLLAPHLAELLAKDLGKSTEMVLAAIGGVSGIFLIDVLGIAERAGLSRDKIRLVIGILAAAVLSVVIAVDFDVSILGGIVGILFAIAFWLFFEATTSEAVWLRAGPLSAELRKALRGLAQSMFCATLTGTFAGVLRAMLGASDISGNVAIFLLFPVVAIAVAIVTRLWALRLFEPGAISNVRSRRLAIADGVVLGAFVGMVTALPTVPLRLGDSFFRTSLLWLFLGPLIGLMDGIVVGGFLMLLSFAAGRLIFSRFGVSEPTSQAMGGGAGAVASSLYEVEPAPAPVQVEAQPYNATGPVAAAPSPPRAKNRWLSCCMGGCALLIVVVITPLAMMSSCKTVDSDRDYARLPEGCPPDCVGADMSNSFLDCVPTRDERCVDFHDADLTGIKLENSTAMRAKFARVILRKAHLKGTNLSLANLAGSDLSEADLRGVSLNSAKLIDAVLVKTDLRSASLHGADLSGANLKETNLRGALYDSRTVWPAGFDPVAAGAKKEGF